jgi:cyclophilin family peptidyl-prolyl cis-trans isomerase
MRLSRLPLCSTSVLQGLAAAGLLLAMTGCSPPSGNPKVPAGAKSSGGLHAMIETAQGPIELQLLPDAAPKAVENFRLLAEHGYYDGLTFHRIVRGFMIQGGDPSGNGTGGESAWGGTFEDEITPDAPLYRDGYRRGIVAMANAGPNTNGSQFFIMHEDYALPPSYVIFARVTQGLDTVDAIAGTAVARDPGGEPSQPITPPIIEKVTIRP